MKNLTTFAFVLAAFLLVFLPRAWFIARYGSSVPFWDQWGAESNLLYKPIVEGTFSWSTLWGPHNEHRILIPRLWLIGLFKVNQLQWDPMVQLLANNLVVAIASSCAMLWTARNVRPVTAIGLCAGLLALLWVPNGWANTLVGFQICFYFVAIFGVLAIGVAAKSDGTITDIALFAVLVVATQLSLAAGLLIFPGILLVVGVRLLSNDIPRRSGLTFIAATFALFALSYAMIPAVTHTEELRAVDFGELAKSSAIAMVWPFSSPLGLIIWTPTLGWIVRSIFVRTLDKTECVFIGIALWMLTLCFAIGYTRGHMLGGVESRYTDLLGLGVLANGYLAVRLVQGWIGTERKALVVLVSLVTFTAVVFSFHATYRVYVSEWQDWSGRMQVAASNVSRYLSGDQGVLEDKPLMYIPTPAVESKGLAYVLSDATVRSFLPFSLLPLGSQTAGAAMQSCFWSLQADRASPMDGSIHCGPPLANESAPQVGVGRLSFLAYSFWGLLGYPGATKATPIVSTEVARGSVMSCSLDSVDDQASPQPEFSIAYGGAIKLNGWAGPRVVGEPIRFRFRSAVSGDYVATALSSLPRPDVAGYTKDTRLAQAGYAAWIDGSALPIGRYDITMSTTSSAECSPGRSIEITATSDPRIAY